MNDFKILLQAVLDANSIGESDIKKIQKVIEKYHLNLTADLDKAGIISEIKKIIPELEAELKKITGVDIQINDDALIKAFNQIERQAEKTAQSINKIQHSLSVGDYDAHVETIKKGFLSISGNADEAETHVKELRDALKSMRDATDDNGRLNAEKAYQLELEKTRNQLTISRAKAKEYVDSFKVNKLRNDIQDWLRKNTAATQDAKEAMQSYLNMLSSDKISPIDFNTIKNEFDNWDTQMRKAGRLGKSLIETFKEGAKSFAQWTVSSGAVMEVWNTVRKGVEELKELDNILTEISKTSDLTASQLKELGNIAFESASKYGKSASDYLTGVQEMYRSGFSNASEMAEVSILAQAAGDMDSTIANDYLLATNAAYKYKGSVEELTKVLNGQNYITNNAAISMKDIADATTETASVAAQYGVQIDELSALIATATANTRESGSEVGTALKAIMINLQDTTSKPVTETFDALGISMTKVVNGSEQLKTPIELIYELAKAYNSLPEGDIMRANILNEIGQKRHANTLAAVLSDMDGLNHMLELYNSNLADNSAYNEAMKSANNWSGSLNKVKNSLNDLIQNFTESETIIGFLDLINGLVVGVDKLTESLGTLGTIGLGGGIFAGLKNVGKPKMYGFVKYADNYKCSLGY